MAGRVRVRPSAGRPETASPKKRRPLPVLGRHEEARAGAVPKADIPRLPEAKAPPPRGIKSARPRQRAVRPDRDLEEVITRLAGRPVTRPAVNRRQEVPCRVVPGAPSVSVGAYGGPRLPRAGVRACVRAACLTGARRPVRGRLGAAKPVVQREILGEADRDQGRPAAAPPRATDPRDPPDDGVGAAVRLPIGVGQVLTKQEEAPPLAAIGQEPMLQPQTVGAGLRRRSGSKVAGRSPLLTKGVTRSEANEAPYLARRAPPFPRA